MNPHFTMKTSQHPCCMPLCLSILKPRLPGLVEIFLVEIYKCKLCRFTSRIKSKIRRHLAQICETSMACQISGCPKMDQGKNELYSIGDEKNENKGNLAENYSLVACVSDALLLWYELKHNPHASHSCEINTWFGEVAAYFQLKEPRRADISFIFQEKGQINPVCASQHLPRFQC